MLVRKLRALTLAEQRQAKLHEDCAALFTQYFQDIHDIWTEPYRQAGMPYGDTGEGMWRWWQEQDGRTAQLFQSINHPFGPPFAERIQRMIVDAYCERWGERV